MSTDRLEYYRVWDAPTRWFHWVNFACVLGLTAIGAAILFDKELGVTDAGKILLKTAHVWCGYVFVINLALRIFWAFVGSRYARWSAIIPFRRGYGGEFANYVRGLMQGQPHAYLGHNPVARAMVALLLIVLLVQAATGLVLAGTDIYYPPFGHWIASWVAAPGIDPSTLLPYSKSGIEPAAWDAMRAFRAPLVTVHYWSFYVLLVMAAIHVVGVVATEYREGGDIVSAMLTGKKVFDRRPIDADPPT